MKSNPDPLWHDTLREDAPSADAPRTDSSDFSSLSLACTLAEVRRVKRARRLRRTVSLSLLVAGLGFAIAWPFRSALPPPAPVASHPAQTLPHPAAPPPFAPAPQIVTHHPPAKTGIRSLSDEELLASFPGQTVGFVGTGPQRRFIIVDSGVR